MRVYVRNGYVPFSANVQYVLTVLSFEFRFSFRHRWPQVQTQEEQLRGIEGGSQYLNNVRHLLALNQNVNNFLGLFL